MRKYDKYGGRVKGADERTCHWPACAGPGEFRAPRDPASVNGRAPESPTGEGESRWFCLDHVRAYNEGWNFFQGMSDAEIEEFRRDNDTWHRPTWPLGSNGAGNPHVDDPLHTFSAEEIFSAAGFGKGRAGRPAGFSRPLNTEDAEALNLMGLDNGAAPADIKARFKELVKRLHPDLNGGDNSREAKLRDVIEAYNRLSSAFAS